MEQSDPHADEMSPPGSELERLLRSMDPHTRRKFLQRLGGAGIAFSVGSRFLLNPNAAEADEPVKEVSQTVTEEVRLTVNGRAFTLKVDPRTTLLDALRETLDLTGTKKGCDHGQCGACTVLVNGRRINSCLSLALTHHGDEITTIEGLAGGGELHPVQAAFIKHDGFQCGYCTPGQICSAVALLKEGHAKNDAEIREWMSGNICRCGAYPNIVAAIREVQDQNAAHSPGPSA